MRTSTFAFICVLALPAVTLAQPMPPAAAVTPTPPRPVQDQPAQQADPEEADPEKAGTEAQAAAKKKAAEAQRKQKEAQLKQQRMEKIAQTSFDRRPSAILKAWSTPLDTDDGEQKDAADDSAGEAAVDRLGTSQFAQTTSMLQASDIVDDEGVTVDAVETPSDDAGSPDKSLADGPQSLKTFAQELKVFRRNVTLGDWDYVQHYLVDLPEDEGQALYAQMLQSFRAAGAMMPVDLPEELKTPQIQQMLQQQFAQRGLQERHVFSVNDLLALASCAPYGEIEKKTTAALGRILQGALAMGNVVEHFVREVEADFDRPSPPVLTRRQVAQLLFAAGQPIAAGEFLPELPVAQEEEDHEALNLLARHFLALHSKDKKALDLEKAWLATQAVLASGKIEKTEKQQALRRSVELASKVRDELGQTWLEESFTVRPERGMEVIATIGINASQGMMRFPHQPALRQKGLDLQKTAVEALIQASPERHAQWRTTLNLLAMNWLREADYAYLRDQSTQMGPVMQRDPFGNFYYAQEQIQQMQYFNGNEAAPIRTSELLDVRPGDAWLDSVESGMRPKFNMTVAKLFLKVGEEDEAFPFIEQLAASHPKQAKELVDEFLRVWTKNHDPNQRQRRTNVYMFMFGFERRANGIPLTRSKQQRNLDELSRLVARLRELMPNELNEKLLTRAFTTCHSSAEVYQLDAIERVFGSVDALNAETLAELVQQMRGNLAGMWRDPAVQKKNQTNRKKKDLQLEVLAGYETARNVLTRALEKYPEAWQLHLARAAVRHDENNYRHEVAPSSKFSERMESAFADFRRAVELYSDGAEAAGEDNLNTQPFELWFYASLGAVDLGQITKDKLPDLRQPAEIREAIEALPGDLAERHMAMFANSLFTRMSAVKPDVKFRYLREGFHIVGDHPRAQEARRVFDYYQDLVTEIKLETRIDGSDQVGHGKSFGVFVNLRHTREIERESGGFGRYLQNQNAGRGGFYYNYGRPTEDYRDKFETAVRQALEEHFEVQSVTFQSADVNSKASGEYGWRVTPYAYLLLKARVPEVDKLPPLQLDLDFLDTSGYVVLPIASPALPMDAAGEATPRPFKQLAVTQTLDERQADEGKLLLEVKAQARGLVPDFDDILKLSPAGFEIAGIEDQGNAVARFDPESDETLVETERTWMVDLRAAEDLEERPREFAFASAVDGETETVYQRYDDADLASVERIVLLEAQYGEPTRADLWWIVAALGGGSIVLLGLVMMWPKRQAAAEHSFQVPASLTPFTVIGLLREIANNNGLADRDLDDLNASIDRLEQCYFATSAESEPDLREIAESWVRRSARRRPVTAPR